jgi:hypothetical protein
MLLNRIDLASTVSMLIKIFDDTVFAAVGSDEIFKANSVLFYFIKTHIFAQIKSSV